MHQPISLFKSSKCKRHYSWNKHLLHILVFSIKCEFYPVHHFHLSPGLTATSTAHPLLPSGPQALEPHKGALTREKKEPVPLGRDYILVRFFSPLGWPPLNPPLPWLESEQGKAGWIEKRSTHVQWSVALLFAVDLLRVVSVWSYQKSSHWSNCCTWLTLQCICSVTQN